VRICNGTASWHRKSSRQFALCGYHLFGDHFLDYWPLAGSRLQAGKNGAEQELSVADMSFHSPDNQRFVSYNSVYGSLHPLSIAQSSSGQPSPIMQVIAQLLPVRHQAVQNHAPWLSNKQLGCTESSRFSTMLSPETPQ
jgi:hypothetical protein